MYLRLDVDGKRGNARLKASIAVRQRTREMYEALGSGGGHTGQIYRRSGYSFEDAVSRSVKNGGSRRGERKEEGPLVLFWVVRFVRDARKFWPIFRFARFGWAPAGVVRTDKPR